jgi:hypothetical protein
MSEELIDYLEKVMSMKRAESPEFKKTIKNILNAMRGSDVNTSDEEKQVKAAVHKKFPEIGKKEESTQSYKPLFTEEKKLSLNQNSSSNLRKGFLTLSGA